MEEKVAKFMNKRLSFDCIVIGGGLSGLTATLALSKIGLSMAIFDKTSLKMVGIYLEYVVVYKCLVEV